MILKEFKFNGISFDSCALDGTQPFKLIVERYNPERAQENDNPSTVENDESDRPFNGQPAILNDCELPVLSDELSSELINKPALLHDYELANFDGELSSDLLDIVPFNHQEPETFANSVNGLPSDPLHPETLETPDADSTPKSTDSISIIPLVPDTPTPVNSLFEPPRSSSIIADHRINCNTVNESIDTWSLTGEVEPVKCLPPRQGQTEKHKKVRFAPIPVPDLSTSKSPFKTLSHSNPLIQPSLNLESQHELQSETPSQVQPEAQPISKSGEQKETQHQPHPFLPSQPVIPVQAQPFEPQPQVQQPCQYQTSSQLEIPGQPTVSKPQIQQHSSNNVLQVGQTKSSDKTIIDPLFDQPTCSKYLDSPKISASSTPRVINQVPSNNSSTYKRNKVVCRKSTAPASSFKIRKLNDKNEDDEDDADLDIFKDADLSSTEGNDSSDDDVQPKRPAPNVSEKSGKAKAKKSPYPSAMEVQNAILYDLNLQLSPKVHVVRLPNFIDLRDPANELEQLCATFSNNLFKDSNERVDYIHRYVPGPKKEEPLDSDDDTLPNLCSQFNKPDPRKRLKITDDSDEDHHEEEPEKMPFPKPKRARMSSCAKPRKRILSIESDSSTDDTDEMDDGIMLNSDDDDDDEDEIVLNETEEKEYSALPDEEKYNFLEKRKRKFARRDRQKALDLITLSSDEEEALEVIDDPIVVPEAIALKDDLNISSQSLTRKNIKRVLTEAELEKATKEATSKERKRTERLAEQEKQYNKLLPTIEKEREEPSLILDIDLKSKMARVEVNSKLVKELKPHQMDGIKFLYNSTIENVDKLSEEGSGCILAHCMGLGKSLQIISFVHTLLSNPLTKAHIRTILIVVPVNTLKNWAEEFDKWITQKGLNCFSIYEMMNENRPNKRAELLKKWQRTGGVLIIGIRSLATLLDRSKSKLPLKLFKVFEDHLCDPGPDMVIIDEGHLLKGYKTQLCKAVDSLRTKRKIILTGTPLQNNLNEYHTMVSIVAPRLLGSRKEFANRFINPIENGQKADSNVNDVRLMKQRSTILNKLLSGCIQRFGYETLRPFLEPKLEYTIFIRPTQRIAKMYNYYLDHQTQRDRQLLDATTLRLCVNHPALYQIQAENATNNGKKPKRRKSSVQSSESSSPEKSSQSTSNSNRGNGEYPEESSLQKDWYKQFSEADDWTNIELSGKFMMLFKILQACIAVNDKLLVVSQSLETLDLIEKCLTLNKEVKINNQIMKLGWTRGKHYYRIDGHYSIQERSTQINPFNDPENTEARLFLLSTKAGGVGINLIGANRCIIFDVSWNPSDDIQAIFRVYRFGQPKCVYVYRFVTKDTMEEKIFRNQIQKLGMAIRVVDKHQVKRTFKAAELAEFYETRPQEEYEVSLPNVPDDRLLADILHADNGEVLEYNTFDTLLEKSPEEELTEEQRLAAWAQFEREQDAGMNLQESVKAFIEEGRALEQAQEEEKAKERVLKAMKRVFKTEKLKYEEPIKVKASSKDKHLQRIKVENDEEEALDSSPSHSRPMRACRIKKETASPPAPEPMPRPPDQSFYESAAFFLDQNQASMEDVEYLSKYSDLNLATCTFDDLIFKFSSFEYCFGTIFDEISKLQSALFNVICYCETRSQARPLTKSEVDTKQKYERALENILTLQQSEQSLVNSEF